MKGDQQKPTGRVPEPTLRRLPWYLAFLKLLRGCGEVSVSSTQIGKEIGVDPSQVAKDLSFVNISGKTRVGYEIDALIDILENFLGFTRQQKEYDATIAIITVPVEVAQQVTDRILTGGIRALWNFTPFRIRVPENVVVQNTSIYAHLAVMFNRLNSIIP